MLDAEIIRMQMFSLGLNTAVTAELSGVPPGKLSLFIGGTKGLRNDEIARVRHTIDGVKRLVEAAEPFPISFKNTTLIRELIQRARDGEFDEQEAVQEK